MGVDGIMHIIENCMIKSTITLYLLFSSFVLFSQIEPLILFEGDTCMLLPKEYDYRSFTRSKPRILGQKKSLKNGSWIQITNNKKLVQEIYESGIQLTKGLKQRLGDISEEIRIFNLKNNRLHGGFKVYSEKGLLLQKGFYKNGMEVGHWLSFSPNGQIEIEQYYSNRSLPHELITYNENGTRKSRYINIGNQGKKGLETHWYKDGKSIKKQGLFINQNHLKIKDGEWNYWHENGEIQKVVKYKNGVCHGTAVLYDNTGSLLQYEFFKKGKLKKTTKILLPERDDVKYYTEIDYDSKGKEKKRRVTK